MKAGFLIILLCISVSYVLADAFLSSWLHNLLPVLGQRTIYQLALPGTTQDLDLIISEGGIDDENALAEVLHVASELGILPRAALEFVRRQARTQPLTLTQQLDAGVRFVDFRMMRTDKNWRSLHMLQTKQLASVYMQELHAWMVAHPSEVVVLWTSKHGVTCAKGNDQYPNVTKAEKQEFWSEMVSLFGALMIDTHRFPPNTTAVSQLVQANARLLVLATDWEEFTGSSVLALDACAHLDNELPASLSAAAIHDQLDLFSKMSQTRARNQHNGVFTLVSLAASAPGKSYIPQFLSQELPQIGKEFNLRKCAAAYLVPVMNQSDWCPPTLQDISQMTNYYNQLVFEAAVAHNWTMPSAIYLDAVDVAGTIRTGTGLFQSSPNDPSNAEYAYVDTMLLLAVQDACRTTTSPQCDSWIAKLRARRSLYPSQRWDDGVHGRLTNWP